MMFALPYIFGFLSKDKSGSIKCAQLLKEYGRTHKGRPPNILVYTGNGLKNSERFQMTKELLKKCLDQDKYVIYQLQDNLMSHEPWQENTEVLVLASGQIIENSHESIFESYVNNGGKMLSFSKLYTFNGMFALYPVGPTNNVQLCDKLKDFGDCLRVQSMDTAFKFDKGKDIDVLAITASTSQPVAVSIHKGDGKAVLCAAEIFTNLADDGLENDQKQFVKMLLTHLGVTCGSSRPSALTNAYLLADEKEKEIFLKSIEDVLTENCFKGNDMSIQFNITENEESSTSSDNLSVVTLNPGVVSFDFLLYKEYLKTKHLGQLVIYSEVITSTQTILNSSLKMIQKLPHGCGTVVVGRQQTIGKGRGGNTWLSPDGCLSFSFPLQVSLNSSLGQRLPFVQHIAALAVVEAVRRLEGYENIDMRIKWPNDIYFGKKTKIGGILVNSSIHGRTLYAVIGIGVNLDNSEPTTCINNIVEQQNLASNLMLQKICREQFLARILNEIEDIIQDFQEYGARNFLGKYYSRWLHSNAKVRLNDDNGEEVTIQGLDDMGFLSVVNNLNEVQSVQPDGNSFDMMRNLITVKSRKQ